MEKNDLAISGRFYYKGSFQEIMVGVSSGVISAIGKNLPADRTLRIDGGMLPASTDTHVHFRDPGETEKEDFSTGSLSAIYGGTTTVMDMPNNRVPLTDYERFEDKLSAVRHKSYCDFGLFSLYDGSNAGIISRKSNGIKIFLGGSTNAEGTTIMEKDVQLINAVNAPVFFHAEDQKCLDANRMEEQNLRMHNLARPSECEAIAVKYALESRIERKVITHISDFNSIPALVEKGTTIYEATPHHLLLNDSSDAGPVGKVNPPLRSREVQQNLLQKYLDGKIDIVSSDHAPHRAEEKEEFPHAKSGIIGVETRVPLLLGLVSKHVLDLETFYRTAIYNPARLFNLRKGNIEIGYAADFISFRTNNVKRINPDRLHSKNPFSPFGGFEAVFPDFVMISGNVVLEHGEAIDDHLGKYIEKTP
jgi:dihydroorotase